MNGTQRTASRRKLKLIRINFMPMADLILCAHDCDISRNAYEAFKLSNNRDGTEV